MVLIIVSCEKEILESENKDASLTSTLSNPDLCNGCGDPIEDYFYDFEKQISARYTYQTAYITSSKNTFNNLDPLIDTLNFSTFPSYNVEIDGQDSTVGYQLSITSNNLEQYTKLYPLNERDPSENDWCVNLLVEEQGGGSCNNDTIEVSFDYQKNLGSTTGKDVDTVSSLAVYENVLSVKEAEFSVLWTDVESINWDGGNGRYNVNTGSSKSINVTMYDSTNFFDSLIYIGVLNTVPDSIDGLMLVDRTEWVRSDIEYVNSEKIFIELDTFYATVSIPDSSPLFRINEDCNQNLEFDEAEIYYDFGLDWCPDSLETGDGKCVVTDQDEDGSILDEEPCNCLGDWRAGDVLNPDWEIGSIDDPNGDNWNDCGLDGICDGSPNDTPGNENETEFNNKWDYGEGYEENGAYDLDEFSGEAVKPTEYFIDLNNGVIDVAEFYYDADGNGSYNLSDPFEDRNCNGVWDEGEVEDIGNGVWDSDEKFSDITDGSGQPLDGVIDSLYTVGEAKKMENLIVDYTDPANPVEIIEIDDETSAVICYGICLGSADQVRFEEVDSFLFKDTVIVPRRSQFDKIDSVVTIYSNKIIEPALTGVSEDYYVAKTKWRHIQDQTAYKESDMTYPYFGDNYGYDYHLFQIGESREVYKVTHPDYFKYYGYYSAFDELNTQFWSEELTQKEPYIHTYSGLLRDGEFMRTDTILVTSVADYYIESIYEVQKEDESLSVPFKKVTGGDARPCSSVEGEINLYTTAGQSPSNLCDPENIVLTDTYKIINTKLVTMIGSGVEFGLRNTIWLGSAGEGVPLGIVKDKLEIRWSEPYWQEYGSGWTEMSVMELISLKTLDSELSRLSGLFNLGYKNISLDEIETELGDKFEKTPTFGLHRIRFIDHD